MAGSAASLAIGEDVEVLSYKGVSTDAVGLARVHPDRRVAYTKMLPAADGLEVPGIHTPHMLAQVVNILARRESPDPRTDDAQGEPCLPAPPELCISLAVVSSPPVPAVVPDDREAEKST